MKFIVLTKSVIEAESLSWALAKVEEQKKRPVAAFREEANEELSRGLRKLAREIQSTIHEAQTFEIVADKMMFLSGDLIDIDELEGAWTASDVVDKTTGEVLLEANTELPPDKLSVILDEGLFTFSVYFPDRATKRQTALADQWLQLTEGNPYWFRGINRNGDFVFRGGLSGGTIVLTQSEVEFDIEADCQFAHLERATAAAGK